MSKDKTTTIPTPDAAPVTPPKVVYPEGRGPKAKRVELKPTRGDLRQCIFRDELQEDGVYSDFVHTHGHNWYYRELDEAELTRYEDFVNFAAKDLGLTREQYLDDDYRNEFLRLNPDMSTAANRQAKTYYASLLDYALVDWTLPTPFDKERIGGMSVVLMKDLTQRILAGSNMGDGDAFFTPAR